MKKRAIVLLAFTVALTAVSCQREALKEAGTTPMGEVMTISAVSEGIGAEAKVEMAYKYDLLWQKDDEILVKKGTTEATFTLQSGEKTTKGTFTCQSSPFQAGDEVDAYYPKSIVSEGNLVWPATMTDNQTVPMYCKKTLSSTENQTFNFASLGSVLQLTFSTTSSDIILKSIEVKADEAMSGAFTVENGQAKVSQPEDDKPGITLDLGDEGVKVGVTAKKFNIAVPAGEYHGLSIVFTATDGKECTINAKKDKAIGIVFNTVNTLAVSGEFKQPLPAGALKGVFSVSATKKVHFSQGNLFWDGDSYEFEDSQFSSSWNETDHVGLFFWSKDASVSRGKAYLENATSPSDVFFTNADVETAKPDFTAYGKTGVFRTLSIEEWDYLLKSRENAGNLFKGDVTVCGVEHCLVISPDNCTTFNKTKTSYNASEWAAAESAGIVCLSPDGYRNNIDVSDTGINGFYWASNSSDNTKASNIGLQYISNPYNPLYIGWINEEPSHDGTDIHGPLVAWGTGSQLTKEVVDGKYCYHISTTTKQDPTQVQFAIFLNSGDFPVREQYKLTITAKASQNYAMQAVLQHTADEQYYSCGDFEKINLSTQWNELEVFTVSSGAGANALFFSIGDFVGDIYIAEVDLAMRLNPKLDFFDTWESNTLQGWGYPEGIFYKEICPGYYYMRNNSIGANPWDTQLAYSIPGHFRQGQKYTIKMKVRSDPSRTISGCFQNSGTYDPCGDINLGTSSNDWQELYTVATCTSDNADRIVFNIADVVGDIYLERFSVVQDDTPRSDLIGPGVNNRYFGFPVRLVCDVVEE